MSHYHMTQKEAYEHLSKALKEPLGDTARTKVAIVAQWLHNLVQKKYRSDEYHCPECNKSMQLLYTHSSQTEQYARVGYLCPFCDVVVLDEWDNHEDAVFSRITKIGTSIDDIPPFMWLLGITEQYLNDKGMDYSEFLKFVTKESVNETIMRTAEERSRELGLRK